MVIVVLFFFLFATFTQIIIERKKGELIMFREFREVEKRFDAQKEENLAYLQIKPQTSMTVEEAKKFMDELFKK